jgi:hypothetical protein
MTLTMQTVRQFTKQMLMAFCLAITTHAHATDMLTPNQIDSSIKQIASQLQAKCPLSEPDNQAAFDQCRKYLFDDSQIKQTMNQPVILWGRQNNSKLPLKETALTQFSPDILAGLYLPLFMFNGQYKISFHEGEKLYLATLGSAFRNRLQPGQFPYPFWHDANKWSVYENARTVLLWLDPYTGKARAIQFSVEGDQVLKEPPARANTPKFDGKWVWTDAQGQTQPTVTLFDGLYRSNNPYKPQLDSSYKEFAIALRESQCLSCHVPNNPDKMKRLVLLQSPAHASAEIHRVLTSVRDKKMPLDDLGLEKELDPHVTKILLDKGGEFEKVVTAAQAWERQQGALK